MFKEAFKQLVAISLKIDKPWHRVSIKYLQTKGLTPQQHSYWHTCYIKGWHSNFIKTAKVVSWIWAGKKESWKWHKFWTSATVTTEENINRLHHKLMGDMWFIINQMTITIGISRERIDNSLHNELGMTKVSAQWMIWLLKPNQKHNWLITLQRKSDSVWGRSNWFLWTFPNPEWFITLKQRKRHN